MRCAGWALETVRSLSDQDWQGRRSDARRNHARVLAAAIEVFTEHGLGATIPQVAARAGVGKATVYRSYPRKSDLVHAVAQLHHDWLRDVVVTAAGHATSDAYGALEAALEQITTRLAEDKLMIEVLASGEATYDDHDTWGIDEILACGKEQGTLRQDATPQDIQVLFGGAARALLELGIDDAAEWRRYARLALAALRP